MTLCEELFFEITVSGTKSELKKLVSFLESGGLDDFFEYSAEYIDYDDSYSEASEGGETQLVFTNDDFGIEIDEFDTDEFLELFCKAAKNLDARGRLSDIDDEEYSFVSTTGDSYYLNADKMHLFNDELDAEARKEEADED
jgi:hypothetical protein